MEKEIIIVVGLGFGDEGKGSIVDYLTRIKRAKVVVRYTGGAQAGHNVVTPEGLHHTFSQFGSGTFIVGVKTHLSRFMIVNPLSIVREEEHLQTLGIKDAFSRTTIDENALITTPFQIAANRILEIMQGHKKGTCGLGIGKTIEDYSKFGAKVLFAKDLDNPASLLKKLGFLQEQNREAVGNITPVLRKEEMVKKELDWLEDKEAVNDLTEFFFGLAVRALKIVNGNYLQKLVDENDCLIFEGAQGTLLDRKYGFYPYITKADTTFANAHKLLKGVGFQGNVTRVGVLRAYATRHGAGPLPNEDETLKKILKDEHNPYNQWQGHFRIGWLDIPLTRYAIGVNGGVDYIALTNLDRLSNFEAIKVRTDSGLLEFSAWQECVDFLQSKDGLDCPIKILSFGPTWKDKKLIN